MACLCANTLIAASLLRQGLVPPNEPDVHPLIADTYPEDSNHDRIADGLVAEVERLKTTARASLLAEERVQAQGELAAPVDVELIFNRQVTQGQINAFAAMGGEITYLYRSVSYGWNGRIPREQIPALPNAMGDAFVLVHQPLEAQLHLDLATRTGRVRPVWANGFAGSAAGYSGSSSITVAIIDTGVDESHLDLNGRRFYWRDFSTDNNASPIDLVQHGSHVAGIALGSGAAGGAATGTLHFSQQGSLAGISGFYPAPIDLPAVSVSFNTTARWTGGGSTTLYLVSHAKGTSGGWGYYAFLSGSSPQTLNYTLVGNPSLAYSPGLIGAGDNSVSNFVVTCQVSAYPGLGDGFNKLRGVAPGCNWAGAKVFSNDGTGYMNWTDAAIDDLVANRVANNIKVMNLSLGAVGNPGISTTTRQKVNTAVNNGIVMVISAGNDGRNSTAAQREIDDPGRAAMALTVGAANDVNQLTDYTSQGFTNPGSTAGAEEDYKPDVMAPGGSAAYYTSILSVDSNSGDGPSFSDQQANDYAGLQGTSMASPFIAGCAALVIDALQQRGTNWDSNSSQHSRFVKMVLCATASESNTNREGNVRNPTLERAAAGPSGFPAGKDLYEGYGMINPDAAVEAASTTLPGPVSQALGPGVTDTRVWGTAVALTSGEAYQVNLTVPATGDFDLYLYSATPSAYGTPVILASSTGAGNGLNETLSYTPSSNTTALLVVKRISGSGTFNLIIPKTIAGTVRYYPTNYPASYPSVERVAGVTVNLTGATNGSGVTVSDGSYSLTNVPGGGTYGVTPGKTNDSPTANGVDSFDQFLIQRHILGRTALGSPYKLLAADVDGSGVIDSFDQFLIQRVILGRSSQFPLGFWRFVPTDYVFSDTNNPWSAPTNRWHTNLLTDLSGQDYVAIKLGDVDNSWVVSAGAQILALETARAEVSLAVGVGPEVGFAVSRRWARPGERVTVPVSVSGFRQVTSAQFTLAWEPTVLRYAGSGDYGLRGLSAGSFGTSLAEEGKLMFAWYDLEALGVTVAEGTTLFTLSFEVVGRVGNVSPLALVDVPTKRKVSVDMAGVASAVEAGSVSVVAREILRVGEAAYDQGRFRLSVPTVAGQRYVLEFTDALPGTHWVVLSAVEGDGTVMVLTDPAATNSQRFYRVRVE